MKALFDYVYFIKKDALNSWHIYYLLYLFLFIIVGLIAILFTFACLMIDA